MPQKDMLEDHKRTGAYFNAVMQNKRQFHDKVVLDVGTGSGILAIFAAMAGAKKVYAVEATNMARNARLLVDHNKVGKKVLPPFRHPQDCSFAPPLSETKRAKCRIARREALQERGVPRSTSRARFSLSSPEPSQKAHTTRDSHPGKRRGAALL
jgi:hypothetical protein